MNRRGVTLIELLMATVIGAIAFLALVIPFIAERAFSITGNNQTEAQRDAQMVLRAMARDGRECNAYSLSVAGTLSFDSCPAEPTAGYPNPGSRCFDGRVGQMVTRTPNCQTPSTNVLIDGVRSKVVNFTATPIITNKLVRVHLEVSHQYNTASPRQRNEVLDTEIFLRNAT